MTSSEDEDEEAEEDGSEGGRGGGAEGQGALEQWQRSQDTNSKKLRQNEDEGDEPDRRLLGRRVRHPLAKPSHCIAPVVGRGTAA